MFFLFENQGDDSRKPNPKALLETLMSKIRMAPRPMANAKHGPAGRLYYIIPPEGIDILVNWLVVAAENGKVCLVPVDDHPSNGPGDLRLASPAASWPMIARCQLASWFPESILENAVPAGILPDHLVDQVRIGLRSISPFSGLPAGTDTRPDWDAPELEEHLETLGRFLDVLLAIPGAPEPVRETRVLSYGPGHFRPGFPPECGGMWRGLAAAGPGWLQDELEKMEASAEAGCSSMEYPLAGGLTLVLMANPTGILPAFRGAEGPESCPVLSDLLAPDGPVALDLEPASGLMVSAIRIPWRQSRVLLGLPDGTKLEMTQ